MSGLDRQSFGSCRINFTGFLLSNIKHANTENKSHTHTATRRLTIDVSNCGDGAVKAFSDVSNKARSWLVRRGQPGLRLSLKFCLICSLLSRVCLCDLADIHRKKERTVFKSSLKKDTLGLQMSRFEYEAEQG